MKGVVKFARGDGFVEMREVEERALAPDQEPRATEYIKQMITMIEVLVEKGHAYEAKGQVLFHVPSMADYGQLSHCNREEMIAGARVEVASYKKDPADFLLWKPSTDDQPGWDSPWGRGRPGWHIECSAMSRKHLGITVDIHGGGADLIFPHHENEVAQSECSCPGHAFVRHWMHNGFLSVNGKKMSKSLGNFITIRQALEGAPGEALRLMLLSTHYRHPLDWTEEGVKQVREQLDYIYKALLLVQRSGIQLEALKKVPPEILNALHNDLNTPLAISQMHEIASNLHLAINHRPLPHQAKLGGKLLAIGNLLGILQKDPKEWFQIPYKKFRLEGLSPSVEAGLQEPEIQAQIDRRTIARNNKDFEEADRIRDALANKGILLEDSPDGTTDWRRTE